MGKSRTNRGLKIPIRKKKRKLQKFKISGKKGISSKKFRDKNRKRLLAEILGKGKDLRGLRKKASQKKKRNPIAGGSMQVSQFSVGEKPSEKIVKIFQRILHPPSKVEKKGP